MENIIEYKGYIIDNGVTYKNIVSVQIWNGDDIIFESVEEAKRFIDNETETFTQEEQEEFEIDENGYSLNGFDQHRHCQWCGEIDIESEMVEEKHFGWLCKSCVSALESRGEKIRRM